MFNKKRNIYILTCISQTENLFEGNFRMREVIYLRDKVIALSKNTSYHYKTIADLYYKLASAGYNETVKQLTEKLCKTLWIKSVYLYDDFLAIDLLVRKELR